jgi:hypothetical protein
MSGDTNIPRSREAMELRAILQGLQDNRWPIVYNTESGTYENRSSFGDQFTRPASQQSHRPQTSPGYVHFMCKVSLMVSCNLLSESVVSLFGVTVYTIIRLSKLEF